jgi:signal transduction histidine kinase
MCRTFVSFDSDRITQVLNNLGWQCASNLPKTGGITIKTTE